MKQYVLTRSAYGPVWDKAANRRRLEVTRAVTARLMCLQAETWTWIVLFDGRDPFLKERMALFESSAPEFVPIIWTPPFVSSHRTNARQQTAAAAYRPVGAKAAMQWAASNSVRPDARSVYAVASHCASWRSFIPSDDTVLMARLDDDDAFAPDALARFRAAANGLTERTILMLPSGVWTWRGQFSPVRHDRNAMHTLVTPPGDETCIYDYSHTNVRTIAPVVEVDQDWGWLWVRHGDTISSARNPARWGPPPMPISAEVRERFPIDWKALAVAWRG